MSSDLVPAGEQKLLTYQDMKPTEEDLDRQRLKHPDYPESKILHCAKSSLLATYRHSIKKADGTRVFGGAQRNSGRPAKPLSEALTEFTEEKSHLVIDAFQSALTSSDEKVRLKAATEVTKISLSQEKVQAKKDKYKGAAKEDLKAAALDLVANMLESGEDNEAIDVLRQKVQERADQRAGITDAEVISDGE